jgi:lysozyme
MINVDKDFDWVARRLEFHEGLKLTPYRCPTGHLIIGVGHNIEAREFTEQELKALGDWKHGITKNGAYMLLKNDIRICLKDLATLDFYESLGLERQYALLDMCFQLGFRKLKNFQKMLSWLKNKEYKLSALECLDSKYAKQTPARAKRIAKLIETGIWTR